MSRLRILIMGCEAEGVVLEQGLRDHAEVIGSERQPALGLITARAQRPDICLVFIDHEPLPLLEVTRQLVAENISVPIVVSTNAAQENILRAMRAGARDFAVFDRTTRSAGPAVDALRAIRDFQQARATNAPPKAGKVITVFGCKGGAGATTVAVNLAHALRSGKTEQGLPPEVVVLDLDTMLGDVMVMLDVSSPFGFRDIIDNLARLDIDLLRSSLARHDSGFYVLAGAGQADPMADVSGQEFDRVLAFLSPHFDYIIIDGVRDFHERALIALDRAESILCLMSQDLPALKNANRALKLFATLGYPDSKIQLLVNRYRSGGKLNVDTISDALRRRVDATVHNDFPAVIKHVNEGALIAQKEPANKVSKDLFALAAFYQPAAPEKRRSLFPFWSKS